MQEDNPSVKFPTVKKINLLNSNSKIFANENENLIPKERLAVYFDKKTFFHKTDINNGNISVNYQVLRDLNIHHFDKISYTINSDTDEKYILIRFFEEKQCIAQFDIKHKNKIGAINNLVKQIRKTNIKFNIINSYNRIADFNADAHWIVMIDCSVKPESIFTLKANLLQESEDLKVLPYTDAFYREVKTLKKEKKKFSILKYLRLNSIYQNIITFTLFSIICLFYILINNDLFNIDTMKPFLRAIVQFFGFIISFLVIDYSKIYYRLKKLINKIKPDGS